MKLFRSFIALLFMLCMSVSAFAASSLVDDAGYLKEGEKSAVTTALQNAEAAHHIRLAIVTKKTLSGQNIGDFANATLDKDYADGQQGAVLLVIEKKGQDGKSEWYIATDKKAKEVISGTGSTEEIGKAIIPLLKKKQYDEAFLAYVDKTTGFYTYYEKNGTAKSGTEAKSSKKIFLAAACAIALLLAFAARWLVCRRLEAEMDNVLPESVADSYMTPGSFQLLGSHDIFLYMNIDRTPIREFQNTNDDDEGSVTMSEADEDHGGGGGFFSDDDSSDDDSDDSGDDNSED